MWGGEREGKEGDPAMLALAEGRGWTQDAICCDFPRSPP